MTASCLEKYRKDLDALVAEAFWVEQSLTLMYTDRDKYVADLTNSLKGDAEKVAVFMKKIQPFPTAYQEWYSEAVTLVRQLMPDRLNDFIKLYEKPKARKEVSAESYRIEDACQGLSASFAGVVRVDAKAASVLLRQQVAIVNAIKRRFESNRLANSPLSTQTSSDKNGWKTKPCPQVYPLNKPVSDVGHAEPASGSQSTMASLYTSAPHTP